MARSMPRTVALATTSALRTTSKRVSRLFRHRRAPRRSTHVTAYSSSADCRSNEESAHTFRPFGGWPPATSGWGGCHRGTGLVNEAAPKLLLTQPHSRPRRKEEPHLPLVYRDRPKIRRSRPIAWCRSAPLTCPDDLLPR